MNQDDGWRRLLWFSVSVAEPVESAGEGIARVMYGKAYGLDAQAGAGWSCCAGRGRLEYK